MEHTQVRWYVTISLRKSSGANHPINSIFNAVHRLTNVMAQYTAAAKSSTLDSTAKSLAALSDVFKKDPKLPVILTAPSLTPGDKSQIVQELQRHMGGVDKGDTVKNFLNTLAENNRLGILEGVCEKFSMLMGAYRGEMELTITSAAVRTLSCPDPSRSEETSLTSLKKLDSKVLQRLETAIAKSEYSQGKKLKVVPKVSGRTSRTISSHKCD